MPAVVVELKFNVAGKFPASNGIGPSCWVVEIGRPASADVAPFKRSALEVTPDGTTMNARAAVGTVTALLPMAKVTVTWPENGVVAPVTRTGCKFSMLAASMIVPLTKT